MNDRSYHVRLVHAHDGGPPDDAWYEGRVVHRCADERDAIIAFNKAISAHHRPFKGERYRVVPMNLAVEFDVVSNRVDLLPVPASSF